MLTAAPLCFFLIISIISAFSPPSSAAYHTRTTATTQTQLRALPTPERMFEYKKKPPTFNKQTSLWEPSIETEDSPYGPWGSFLRAGPSPFLVRVLQPNEYDQAVFKYMAQTKCSRAEAQGNMDAFFNNAADWAYQKSEEARGRPKVDYTEVRNVEKAHCIVVLPKLILLTPIHLSSSFLPTQTQKLKPKQAILVISWGYLLLHSLEDVHI